MQSEKALKELQDTARGLRLQVETCQADCRVLELKIEKAEDADNPEAAVHQMRLTHEQQVARADLLANPVERWSQAQVQTWIGLIGLPSEHVNIVQQALREEEFDGEDLKSAYPKQLTRMLTRAGADDAAGLAATTLKLLAAAGEVGLAEALAEARSQLAEHKQKLRTNDAQVREKSGMVWSVMYRLVMP